MPLNKNQATILFTLFILWITSHGATTPQTPPPTGAPGQKKIVETVDVTNIAIPVRVFKDGKPVMDLEKKDLLLMVNGHKTPINGFYTIKKMITQPNERPRLFVLMFNICDYRLAVEDAVDTFFHRIFRPNDHLIVITRNHFISEKTITNPIEEKFKIKKILQLERETVRKEILHLEQQVKSMVQKFKSRTERYQDYDPVTTMDFFNNYSALVQKFKGLYLNMDTENQLKLARYLAGRDMDKWVLNFYQVGRFVKPRLGSPLFETLKRGLADNSMTSESFVTSEVYEKIKEILEPGERLPIQDLVKEYVNSRTTFHTVLLAHGGNVASDIAGDLTFVPVISDSYQLMKELSAATGGYFIDVKDLESFYQRISAAQDIHYIITFAPTNAASAEEPKKEEIRVMVYRENSQNYNVHYDDGKRAGHFQKLIDKQTQNLPEIHIEKVKYQDRVLSFVVAHFSAPAAEDKTTGIVVKLPVRIQVFNRDSESLFDGVQMFELTQADIARVNGVPMVNLQVGFPLLPLGVYDVFIWIGDLKTGERDLAIHEVSILSHQ